MKVGDGHFNTASAEILAKLNSLLVQERNPNKVIEFIRGHREDLQQVVHRLDSQGLSCLHYAIQRQPFTVIQELVTQLHADVNIVSGNLQTPLHVAAARPVSSLDSDAYRRKGGVWHPVVHFLITHAANPNVANAYGAAPIHIAIDLNLESSVQQLIADGASLTVTDAGGLTPLLLAVKAGHSSVLKLLLTPKVDLKVRTLRGHNVFHYAASSEDKEILQMVYLYATERHSEKEIAALFNQADEKGQTPVHFAAHSRANLKLLVEKGGKLDTITNNGDAVIHYAVLASNVDNLNLLLERGAFLDVPNNELETPLHTAIRFKQHEAASYLINRKCAIDAPNKNNETPLLLAVKLDELELVQLLLEAGADPAIQDQEMMTSLMVAVDRGNFDMVKTVRKYCTTANSIHAFDQSNNCVLHLAARRGNLDIFKFLLSDWSDVEVPNTDGQTPLHIACYSPENYQIGKFLTETHTNLVPLMDNEKNTAMHLAAINGVDNLLYLLLPLCHDVNEENMVGQSPLFCAALNNQLSCVNVMLSWASPAIDHFDKQRRTPLFAACEEGYADIVKVLLANKANPTHRLSLSHNQYPGWNALDVAVYKQHLCCIKVLLDSQHAEKAMRNVTVASDGELETPFRKMIRYIPEAALLTCDKYITVQESRDHGQGILYDFSLIEDSVKRDKERDVTKESERFFLKSVMESAMHEKWEDDQLDGDEEPTSPLAEEDEDCQPRPKIKVKKSRKRFRDALQLMIHYGRVDLLKHDLVNTLIIYKWVHLVGAYLLSTIVYFLFVALLTSFMLQTTPTYLLMTNAPGAENITFNTTHELCLYLQSTEQKAYVHFIGVSKYLVLLLALLNLIKEFTQFVQSPLNYFSIENLLEISLFSLTTVTVLDFNRCNYVTGLRTEWQWWTGTIALVMAWCHLPIFLQNASALGTYVGVYRLIVKNLFKLVILFFPILVAFALTFHLLLANQHSYANVPYSLARVAVLDVDFGGTIFSHFASEAGQENIVSHLPLTITVFFMFWYLILIAMSNMWVGISVGDVSLMKEKAAVEDLRMRVGMLWDIERMLPAFGIKWTVPLLYERCPDEPKRCVDRVINWVYDEMPRLERMFSVAETKQDDEDEEQVWKENMKDNVVKLHQQIEKINGRIFTVFNLLDSFETNKMDALDKEKGDKDT